MSSSDSEKIAGDPHTPEDLECVIEKLKAKDRFGELGQWAATIGGTAAGGAAAGSVAAVAGASTLFGSTTLASALGGVLVVSTPVGWVVGSALVGGALAFGVSQLIKSGARNDRIREEIVARLSARLDSLKNQTNITSDSVDLLKESLEEAIRLDRVTEISATQMLSLVESGKLDLNIAIKRIKDLCESEVTPS